MADAKTGVRSMANTMLRHVQPIAGKNPGAGAEAPDFNAVLAQAKKAFPGAAGPQAIRPFEHGATFGDLAARLAAIAGALAAQK